MCIERSSEKRRCIGSSRCGRQSRRVGPIYTIFLPAMSHAADWYLPQRSPDRALAGSRSTCDDDNSRLPAVTIEVFMSTESRLQRREVIAGLAGLGAALTSAATLAQSATTTIMQSTVRKLRHRPRRSPPSTKPSSIRPPSACAPAVRASHAVPTISAAGMDTMAACQRAVMNMLSVVGAMADVAGFVNTTPANIRSLAMTCARFCDTCAEACEPHAAHHAECKDCREACLACAKACNALAA